MPLQFPRFVDDMMLVRDDEMATAIRLLIETARQIAEGAGAAAVAAALARRDELASSMRPDWDIKNSASRRAVLLAREGVS